MCDNIPALNNYNMKAELETKTLELMTWLEQTIKTSANFTVEQIPLFITELLNYNYVMSLSGFILSVLGLLVTLYWTYRFIKWMKDEDDWELSPAIILILGVILLSCAGITSNTDWIKIKLAPRVYLLEYVQNQLKK